MSELYIPSQQLKPFYSYVDKTFQGELSNGSHTIEIKLKSLCDIIFIK
jgi:hypothetical protein